MSTRRITVEEVLEAYRVTGWKPMRFELYHVDVDWRECGCVNGVIAVANGAMAHRIDINEWLSKNFDDMYRLGIYRGFDGREADDTFGGELRFKQGFTDGQAVAAAVFQKQGDAA